MWRSNKAIRKENITMSNGQVFNKELKEEVVRQVTKGSEPEPLGKNSVGKNGSHCLQV